MTEFSGILKVKKLNIDVVLFALCFFESVKIKNLPVLNTKTDTTMKKFISLMDVSLRSDHQQLHVCLCVCVPQFLYNSVAH